MVETEDRRRATTHAALRTNHGACGVESRRARGGARRGVVLVTEYEHEASRGRRVGGARAYGVERATDAVKILDVDAPSRARDAAGAPDATDPLADRSEEDSGDEDDARQPRSRANAGEASGDEKTNTRDASAVERLTEAVEDFHPVLRPYH